MNNEPLRCETCFDTMEIDFRGAEVGCPDCAPDFRSPVTLKLTGLRGSLLCEVPDLSTVEDHTGTTITFFGTRQEILRDVRSNRARKVVEAKMEGLNGRNYISSAAIALAKRVEKEIG